MEKKAKITVAINKNPTRASKRKIGIENNPTYQE